jgi:hypothetical protein
MMLTPVTILTDYDRVTFRNEEIKEKMIGYRINEYFVVSYNGLNSSQFKIYSLTTGKPAVDLRFATIGDAMGFAEWMSETYKDYLPLWESFPDADIIQLSQWSIKNGVNIAEIISKTSTKKPIHLNQMECLKEY